MCRLTNAFRIDLPEAALSERALCTHNCVFLPHSFSLRLLRACLKRLACHRAVLVQEDVASADSAGNRIREAPSVRKSQNGRLRWHRKRGHDRGFAASGIICSTLLALSRDLSSSEYHRSKHATYDEM